MRPEAGLGDCVDDAQPTNWYVRSRMRGDPIETSSNHISALFAQRTCACVCICSSRPPHIHVEHTLVPRPSRALSKPCHAVAIWCASPISCFCARMSVCNLCENIPIPPSVPVCRVCACQKRVDNAMAELRDDAAFVSETPTLW